MPVPAFETFEVELQNTLNHLYEPFYQPEDCVYQVLEIAPEAGLEAVRQKLVETIEAMGQAGNIPETAKIFYLYRVLQQRFMFLRSQEKASEALEISPRHFRRKQNEAIHVLALQLWNKWQQKFPAEGEAGRPGWINAQPTAPATSASGHSWAETVLPEIALLNQRSLGMTTDLQRVIQRTIEMAGLLLPPDSIQIKVTETPPGKQVPVHPTVLRQVLLFIIQQIVASGYMGTVEVMVRGQQDSTVIVFTTCQMEGSKQIDDGSIRQLAALLGGTFEVVKDDQACALELLFPTGESVSVLVVDDNTDIERLYRQFTANTRYKIFYRSSGVDLIEHIQKIKPQVLVIDVLLPGLDGWDLLLQLRENPMTTSLPVIVSSVLGNPEIARSLGANAYLPKPLDRKALLQALDDAAGQQ